MHIITLMALGSFMASALALPKGPDGFHFKRSVYFLNDNPAGSSIVAVAMDDHGLLTDFNKSTSTQGKGGNLVSASGAPATQDPLGSQGSVVVSGDLLFSVNAGSNTVVMFKINPFDPLQLTMIGDPVNTLGQLPVSVTYSERLHMLCVLNGGDVSGISCFHVDPVSGLRLSSGLMSLGNALKQTTPPSGPPDAASQILFTPDSSAVMGITRGKAGVQPVQPGWIVSYPIQNGRLCDNGTLNAYNKLPMAFGSTYVNDSSLIVVDPSFGAGIVDTSKPSTPELTATINVNGSQAICWVAFDARLQLSYLLDAGRNVIIAIDARTTRIVDSISIDTGSDSSYGPGLFDATVQGNLLFALGGRPGIAVIDLETRLQIQWKDLSALGNRQRFTGMAAYHNDF